MPETVSTVIYVKYFIHGNPKQQILLLSLIHKWNNWNTEKLSNLPKITSKNLNQRSLTPEPEILVAPKFILLVL